MSHVQGFNEFKADTMCRARPNFCSSKWSPSNNSSMDVVVVMLTVGVVVSRLSWQQDLVGEPRLVLGFEGVHRSTHVRRADPTHRIAAQLGFQIFLDHAEALGNCCPTCSVSAFNAAPPSWWRCLWGGHRRERQGQNQGCRGPMGSEGNHVHEGKLRRTFEFGSFVTLGLGTGS